MDDDDDDSGEDIEPKKQAAAPVEEVRESVASSRASENVRDTWKTQQQEEP